MSDPSIPPPLPPVGSRLDPLAGATPAPAPVDAPPAVPATFTPPAGSGASQGQQDAERVLAESFSSGTGTIRRAFSSRRVADLVELEVDGAVYECAPSAPSDRLIAAVEAHESKDQYLLILKLRSLIASVMFPDARARYEARLADAVVETIDGVERRLAPIDPVDMIAHGLWLVEVYFARPTEPSAPSGAGR